MLRSRARSIVASLLAVSLLAIGGCIGTVTPASTEPPPPVTAPTHAVPEPAPIPASSGPIASPPAAARDASAADSGEPIPSAEPIDPADLAGYVMSREASQGLRGSLTARITAVDSTPGSGTIVVWRFALTDAAGTTHTLAVQAPARLPAPLRIGDEVQANVRATGGGPNMRLALDLRATDGTVLLAVNEAPPGWKITRGALASTDRDSDYTERRYGVIFEHAGGRLAVAADTWARVEIAGATYYVWGSAARRTLRPGKRAMPDHVAAWLDSAIVRLR